MASGGGNSGSTTQTTRTEPWSGQQPYLLDLFERAQRQAATPQQFFPGQTYADPAAETLAAQQLQAQRALAGSPAVRAGGEALAATARGDYLGAGNPAFQAALDRSAAAIRPRLDATFAGAGRYGSGAYANALASALSDTAGQLAYQNYADERTNQLRAAALAPEVANQDYVDIARLAEVGGAREDAAQQKITEAMNRQAFAQEEPWQRLARYANLIQGNYGSTSTSTLTGGRRSVGQGLLGGASTGAALGTQIMPGWGTAIGAVAGGLLGRL